MDVFNELNKQKKQIEESIDECCQKTLEIDEEIRRIFFDLFKFDIVTYDLNSLKCLKNNDLNLCISRQYQINIIKYNQTKKLQIIKQGLQNYILNTPVENPITIYL
jgi:hypothetical protein